jgi:hypothetical protein
MLAFWGVWAAEGAKNMTEQQQKRFFQDAVSRARTDRAWTQKALAEKLAAAGVRYSRNRMSQLEDTDYSFPAELALLIARQLEIRPEGGNGYDKFEDIERDYPDTKWTHVRNTGRAGKKTEREDSSAVSADFAAALELLRPSLVRTKDAAEASLTGLFESMDHPHFQYFVVVTTQTVPPAGFKPDEYPNVVQAIYDAMDRGLLVAYIIPTDGAVKHLKNYGFEGLYSNADFRKDFEVFARGYKKRLRTADAAKQSARRTQLFEWSDFPMTPCGRTVSLVGETRGFGNVTNRILERNPSTGGEVSLMADNKSDEDRLRLFIAHVIKAKRSRVSRSRGEPDSRAATWFVSELDKRMSGNPAGYPSV